MDEKGNAIDGYASINAAERPPSTLANLIAGSVGGASQVLVAQPLDTVKTRAQTARYGQFSGSLDIASQTFRKEGLPGFYKGMLSPLIGISGVNALLFVAYASAKRLVYPYGPELPLGYVAASGAIAGAVNSLLASPVEMLKIRMQGQYGSSTDKRLSEVIGDLYRQGGFRHGIMRGFWCTVLREIPAYGAFFSSYELVKRHLHRQVGHDKQLPVWALLTSGGVGGLCYWTACYPLDVVKSRFQLATEGPKGFFYIPRTISAIYRQEGLRAFFRGIIPTYVRSIPSAASTFVAFELTIEFLRKTSVY